MANSTVYPYGTNGELPSNIGLINDLVTGGANKALTAEQGKVLNESLEDHEAVDLSCYNPIPLNAGSDNRWAATYDGIYLPVKPNERYIINTQQTNAATVVVPLKQVIAAKRGDSFASNLATGYSNRIVVSANSTLVFDVPSDCHVLYISNTLGTGNVLPSVVRVTDKRHIDDEPLPTSNLAVKSRYFYKDSRTFEHLQVSQRIEDLVLDNRMAWYVPSDSRGCVLYHASSGDFLHIEANDEHACLFCFLKDVGTMADGRFSNPASARFIIPVGESLDIEAPVGTTLLYVTSHTNDLINTPKVLVKYGEKKIDDLYGMMPFKKTIELPFNGMTTASKDIDLNGGVVYRIRLNKTKWGVSSVSEDYVVFAIILMYSTAVYFEKCVKGTFPKNEYYILQPDDFILRFATRGDAGDSLSVEVTDVTDSFNKEIFDVAFVHEENDTNAESMMVKVGAGDLVRYCLNVTSGTTPIKAYVRSVRDDNYLVDSISADVTGVMTGTYMTQQDEYLVMSSVYSDSFTPYFKVFNYGENPVGKLTSPHQLVFDTDNQFAILASNDAGATQYDNQIINYGQIIQHDGLYYLLYQGFGSYHANSSNILLAYSSDGINWTRGIPSGTEAPYPGTNVIFRRGSIVGEFSTEIVNEFCVARVSDPSNPYRMFCAIRNDNPNTIIGEVHYLFKSSDLVHWTTIRKVEAHAHDSFSSMMSYGDKLKLYLRMWDYTQELTNMRMIGEMWMDIWGNVITPPSGLFGQGLYNPGAASIGFDKELFLPTRFIVTNGMNGDNTYEAYIKDGDVVRWAPCYGIDTLKQQSDLDGWGWGSGLVGIGMTQYFLYSQRQHKHGTSVTGKTELRLCPIKWVTYNSYNVDGEIQS